MGVLMSEFIKRLSPLRTRCYTKVTVCLNPLRPLRGAPTTRYASGTRPPNTTEVPSYLPAGCYARGGRVGVLFCFGSTMCPTHVRWACAHPKQVSTPDGFIVPAL